MYIECLTTSLIFAAIILAVIGAIAGYLYVIARGIKGWTN